MRLVLDSKTETKRATTNRARQQAMEFKLQTKKRQSSPPQRCSDKKLINPKGSTDEDEKSGLQRENIRMKKEIEAYKLQEQKRHNTENVRRFRLKQHKDESKQFLTQVKGLETQVSALQKSNEKLAKMRESDSTVSYKSFILY